MTNIFDYYYIRPMACNYIGYMYNLEPITLSRKIDKNFILNIRGLLVSSDISVRMHPSEQKIKHHFKFQVSYYLGLR